MSGLTYNLVLQLSDGLTLGRLREMLTELADRGIYSDFYRVDVEGVLSFSDLDRVQLWEVRRWAGRHTDAVVLPALPSLGLGQEAVS